MSYVSHAGAALNPAGRLTIAQLVVYDGWARARVAERFPSCSGYGLQMGGSILGRGHSSNGRSVIATQAFSEPDSPAHAAANRGPAGDQAVGSAPDRSGPRRAPTSTPTAPSVCSKLRPNSTNAPAKPSEVSPPSRPSTSYSRNHLLQRPSETAHGFRGR